MVDYLGTVHGTLTASPFHNTVFLTRQPLILRMFKGMGIRMIGSVTLALVGVSILLGVFSQNFGSGAGGVFCSTYDRVSNVFPGKDAPQPEGCGTGSDVEYQVIKASSNDDLELKLSGAIISCYREHRGYNVTDEFCEGWNIKTMPGAVNETDVTDEMIDNNLCGTSISNNKSEYTPQTYSCGTKNQVYFQRQNISQGDFIVLTYNVSTGGTERVEVR